MPLATGAVDFGPWKNEFVVGGRLNHLGIDGLPEAGPASAAVELVLRRIGREVTARAVVDALLFVVVHIVEKGPLGILMPQDPIGRG